MHIAIDASSAANPQRSGIGVYVVNILDALARVDSTNTYSVCYRLSRLRHWRHLYRPKKPSFRLKILQEPYLFPRKADVFHCCDTRLPKYDIPATVAAHADWMFDDAIASESFKRKRRERYDEVARRGSIVIANSQTTRDALVEQTSIRPENIRVNYLGVSEAFHPRSETEIERVRREWNLPPAYAVAVAAFSPRKNMERVLEAYAELKRRGEFEGMLVLVGTMKFWESGQATLDRLGINDEVITTGFVPDEVLPVIYAGARMLVFPSLAEGFGLPLVEAMACGTPAVTSNRSAMPEVAGDAAVLVDPEDTAAIARGMLKLDSDAGPHRSLSEKCLERAKLFSWDRHCRELIKTWEELAKR